MKKKTIKNIILGLLGFCGMIAFALLLAVLTKDISRTTTQTDSDSITLDSAIQLNEAYPQYFQYQGQAVLLLGGSKEDNLFQIPDLDAHLDMLQAVGGNYVRNTMSSRDSGNVWPYQQLENGLYDLDQWDNRYWQRFEHFLKATAKRDIIVQIELWATFDFYREQWAANPYNPKNNINYGTERTHLPEDVPTHPIFRENNFFWSVPAHENNTQVLWYQQKYIDKLLSYSLQYDHVLYCMDNETSVTSEWGKFWAVYIHKKAKEVGTTVCCTEMWDPHELSHVSHLETFDHPEYYQFVDISQNNHISGQAHWDNGLAQIKRLKTMGYLRPVTNVKTYGNDGGRHKTTRDAIESFCRSALFGAASVRFHRPTSGQGLNQTAQHVIKSVRMATDSLPFFEAQPYNELLKNRDDNEAYCRAVPGKAYLVFFTKGGEVGLNLSGFNSDKLSVDWLNITEAKWQNHQDIQATQQLTLTCPDTSYWFVLIR